MPKVRLMSTSVAPAAKVGPPPHGLPDWSGAPLYKKVVLALIFSVIFLLLDRSSTAFEILAGVAPAWYLPIGLAWALLLGGGMEYAPVVVVVSIVAAVLNYHRGLISWGRYSGGHSNLRGLRRQRGPIAKSMAHRSGVAPASGCGAVHSGYAHRRYPVRTGGGAGLVGRRPDSPVRLPCDDGYLVGGRRHFHRFADGISPDLCFPADRLLDGHRESKDRGQGGPTAAMGLVERVGEGSSTGFHGGSALAGFWL